MEDLTPAPCLYDEVIPALAASDKVAAVAAAGGVACEQACEGCSVHLVAGTRQWSREKLPGDAPGSVPVQYVEITGTCLREMQRLAMKAAEQT